MGFYYPRQPTSNVIAVLIPLTGAVLVLLLTGNHYYAQLKATLGGVIVAQKAQLPLGMSYSGALR
ncbi:MAG TPA: hypothetical protein VKW78_10775 [Terriglobales bacterium]|nr:hypothetical protein [Terriglobales bacterium]